MSGVIFKQRCPHELPKIAPDDGVSFTRLAPQIERKPTGEIVGLDMGVTHTVATSKDKFLDMKLLTNRERQPKRRLQRKLASQTKGSNRRNATKLAISKGD